MLDHAVWGGYFRRIANDMVGVACWVYGIVARFIIDGRFGSVGIKIQLLV